MIIGIFIETNLKQMALPMPLEAPVISIYFIGAKVQIIIETEPIMPEKLTYLKKIAIKFVIFYYNLYICNRKVYKPTLSLTFKTINYEENFHGRHYDADEHRCICPGR